MIRVNRILGLTDEEEEKNNIQLQEETATKKNEPKAYNPFLKKNGELLNKYINYQQVLDNPNVSKTAKNYITQATGLSPTPTVTNNSGGYTDGYSEDLSYEGYEGVSFNANADENGLASLDVATELPKLNTGQISDIISKHFSKSTVIKPSDAAGIYKAQNETGMSALAILGIGALESAYGTSNIAKQKNNIWGWNATNVNPGGNATSFSQMSEGAVEFAKKYMKTYYNNYGAKSIYSAGTGNNPKGMGYAYYDNGSINPSWATWVGDIMGDFYKTAKSSSYASSNATSKATSNTSSKGTSSNKLVNAAKKYIGTPYVWGGKSKSAGGFDCSGFVGAALKDAGYKVGSQTAQGYRSYGTKVSKANMQPGDLVFFGKGEATHVGIYIGNGQMIHSSGGSRNSFSNPGKGVEVKSVNYRSDFIEARRY